MSRSPAAGRARAAGFALAMAGAVGFSGKAIVAKLMYRHGVDALTVLGLRMLLALPCFLLMAWWAGRGRPALSRPDRLRIVLLGFSGYYLASYLDFLGLQHISASLERLILYLNPTLVLLLGFLLLGRKVQPRQLLAMGLSYAGVLLVFGHELQARGLAAAEGSSIGLGALLVFGSALSYAVYLVASGELVQRLGSLRLVGLASTVACGFAIAHFLAGKLGSGPWAGLAGLPAPVWGLAVVNSLFCTVAPVLMVMMAVERLGPATAAHTGMVGPLSTLLLGLLLLDEALNPWIGAGTLLVLGGVALLARSPRPAPTPPAD